MYYYYNENLISEDKSAINPLSQGFQFGRGVFETILVLEGKACFLELHLSRLRQGCNKIGLLYSIDESKLEIQLQNLIRQNNIRTGRLKVVCFKDFEKTSLLMKITPNEYKDGFSEEGFAVCLSEIRRNPLSPLSYIKSLNYAENILAVEEARRNGYNEAIFLNVNNKLCEGAVSNIFWVKSSRVYTPHINCGILNGITRSQVVQICQSLGLELVEGSFDFDELRQADEIFVTNSLMGIMPVTRLENNVYNILDYKITRELYYEYRRLIKKELLK